MKPDAMTLSRRTGIGRTGIGAWLRGLFSRSTRSRTSGDDPALQPYRLLARQLLADVPSAEGGRVIFVVAVSDLPTGTLLTIAYFMRDELGSRLLVADATGRPDGAGAWLGGMGMAGLFDLARDAKRRLSDVVQPTVRPGIAVLTTGRPSSEGVGAVHAARIESVLEEARTMYDYTLVQLPPILDDPGFLRFVTLADTVLLVVAEGQVGIEDLARARALLDSQGAPSVRMVLCSTT